jgi:hypothetical protein
MAPNLTEEQKDLLKTIVEVYDSGCKGPFTLVLTHATSSHLSYSGHPDVALSNVTVLDFHQLTNEGLIIFDSPIRNVYTGKPTAKGIDLAHQLFRNREDRHGKWIWAQRQPEGYTDKRTSNSSSPGSVGGEGTPGDPTGASTSTPLAAEGRPNNLVTRPPYVETRPPAIFIGHGGRSREWIVLAHYLKDDLGLTCEEFNAKPPEGYSTQAHLQGILDRATFAFLVMTGEDKHADGRLHARENVIHEAGLFQGKLGIPDAILMVEDGCKIPSNFDGLTHIEFPQGDIAKAFHKVHRVLKARGIV